MSIKFRYFSYYDRELGERGVSKESTDNGLRYMKEHGISVMNYIDELKTNPELHEIIPGLADAM
jgi:hypothetical protein